MIVSQENTIDYCGKGSKWKWFNCVWIFVAHGLYSLQARILEWVAFPFSRGSSQPRDQSQVSCIAGRFFTNWGTREAQENTID